ncbi:hypothetical protein BJ944DRAFT_243383 [Cunninghamella echinulata]|nr:hypothetical protein BJ944DRAFT_243383 [Cunninghamella echinulata]
MAPPGSFKKPLKKKGYTPTPGSVLPSRMKEELDDLEPDDRKFSKRYVNKATNRKELRKQKKLDKTRKRQEYHDHMHQRIRENNKRKNGSIEMETKAANQQQPNKKQKGTTTIDNNQINKKKVTFTEPSQEEEKKTTALHNKKKHKTSQQALDQLARTNPHLYSLLDADNLIEGKSDDALDQDAFEKDDRDIAYWEKKLGMDKQKNKKYGKAFAEDGLLDILGDIGSNDNDETHSSTMDDDDMEYLRQKRLKRKQTQQQMQMEQDAEDEMDNLFADMDSNEEETDDDDEYDDENEYGEDLDMADSEDEEEQEEDDDNSDESGTEPLENEHNKKTENKVEIKPISEAPLTTTTATKYIPPHLRKKATTKSEQQIRLQKQLQGLLNKLSESNMENILLDIEKLYTDYPRNDVNSTVTELILNSISQKSNLLDSFVITYATIVGSLYRLIGIEFAAYFVQTLVESFEKNYKQSQLSIANHDDQSDEGPTGAKETKNLLTLTIELYNFQVISCVLVYDLVRLLIGNLDEQSVELLLKIIRTCGPQMRADDPASLKDIIDEIQKESNKRDPSTISTRHKFMLETITNVKNNKFKSGELVARQNDKEMVMKMKKFLSGLGKKRTVRSAEPLRVSLEDIRQIDTKGKWWLVGASWKANLVGTESEHAKKKNVKLANDLKKDQSLQEALLKLARKQGMNTDIRRSIFISIMGGEDYLDAFEKLMKLGLTEVQQREIPRVLLQCIGNEKTYNPYYTFVSRRLCEYNHSYKVTYQYCLWDFLREIGQTEVGGLERSQNEVKGSDMKKSVRLSRVVNIAKCYANLIVNKTLSLTLFRTINFMSLSNQSQIFLDVLFSNILLSLQSNMDDLKDIFLKVAQLPTLAQGCLLHLQGSLLKGNRAALNEDELQIIQSQCKIVKTILKSSSSASSSSSLY